MAARGTQIAQFVALLLVSMPIRGGIECMSEQEFRDKNYNTMEDTKIKNMLDNHKDNFFNHLYNKGHKSIYSLSEEPIFEVPSSFLEGTLIKRIPFDNNKVGDIENEVNVTNEFCKGEKPIFQRRELAKMTSSLISTAVESITKPPISLLETLKLTNL